MTLSTTKKDTMAINRRCFQRPLVLLALSAAGTSAFVVRPTQVALPPLAQKPLSFSRSPKLKAAFQETLLEKLPSKAVIDAIEVAPDGRVIASDVAAAAGVSLSQARKDLTALASITKGDIAVSRDGELIYVFPRNINGVLASNSAKYKALQVFRKAWPLVFFGVRVSFGVVLLASLAAIFSTIFFLSQSSSSDDDRRRDRGGFGGGSSIRFDPFWGPSPFDFFYYRPYYGYYGTPGQPARDPEEMGFLESTFSYVFGDGNPNMELETMRLSLAANMIRDNNGSVTAEQLAPFCDNPPEPSMEESTYVDESFVLPIVSQLDGEPRVTEDGHIVYVFPDLQVSAASSTARLSSVSSSSAATTLKRAGLSPDADALQIKQLLNLNGINTRGVLEKKDLVRMLERALPPMTEEEKQELIYDDPTLLQEREYKFSLATPFNRVLAGGLGALNLFGALYLGNMLSAYALYGVQLPSYFGLVQAAYPLLLGYAVLFNVIPLARSFWIRLQNDKIRQRNRSRRLWKSVLESEAMGKLAQKLKAAKQMGRRMLQLGASEDDIVFDTRQPMEDIEKVRQKSALDEFDQLLDKEDGM